MVTFAYSAGARRSREGVYSDPDQPTEPASVAICHAPAMGLFKMGLANLYTMLYAGNWARPDEELRLMPSGHKESVSNVEKAYWMLKELLIVYRLKPGGRIGKTA